MLTILTALLAGISGGALAGALAGWWTGRRSAPASSLDDLVFDPDLDEQIGDAARGWAMRQGQPAAAPLVARKLRLMVALNQRRLRRRGRWSR